MNNCEYPFCLKDKNHTGFHTLNNKKYKIIYADPPWKMEFSASKSRDVDKKYDVMNYKDIANIDVNNISDNDSILFMWTTYPKLEESFYVLNSWGFKYRTVGFVWIKKYSNNTNYLGMGNYTRANSEIVLIGVKGKGVKTQVRNISQIIQTVMIPDHTTFINYKHSKKPDIVRTRIVQLCGDLPRIELFARTKIHGWDVWGNDEKLTHEPLEAF